MFSNMFVSMFFNSCVEDSGPTKHADGTCKVDSSPEECPSTASSAVRAAIQIACRVRKFTT